MFVEQDGKLYVEDKGKLVGINVGVDKVSKVAGTTCNRKKNSHAMTASAMRARYNISEENSYEFPKPKPKTRKKTTKKKSTTTKK
jgi:hypothetical protein